MGDRCKDIDIVCKSWRERHRDGEMERGRKMERGHEMERGCEMERGGRWSELEELEKWQC